MAKPDQDASQLRRRPKRQQPPWVVLHRAPFHQRIDLILAELLIENGRKDELVQRPEVGHLVVRRTGDISQELNVGVKDARGNAFRRELRSEDRAGRETARRRASTAC